VGLDHELVGLDRGLVALDWGLVGLDRGLVGLDHGLVGLDWGLVGLDRGLVGLDCGLGQTFPRFVLEHVSSIIEPNPAAWTLPHICCGWCRKSCSGFYLSKHFLRKFSYTLTKFHF